VVSQERLSSMELVSQSNSLEKLNESSQHEQRNYSQSAVQVLQNCRSYIQELNARPFHSVLPSGAS
jgi:hypothetical protein